MDVNKEFYNFTSFLSAARRGNQGIERISIVAFRSSGCWYVIINSPEL